MAPFGIQDKYTFKGLEWEIWEKVDGKFLRACLAEFMAMHLFVLLCCGCAMVTLALDYPNFMMVAASFGFGILVLAHVFGPLSGGHINCAVSAGLFVAGRCSLLKAVCYTLSQMLGSICGALFLWAIFGNNWPAARAFGSNSWDPAVFTGGQVFFAEMLGTALLMFNVLSTIDIPIEGGGPLGVYPIAMSVMIAHLFLLPIDGCSINPTRSFGPFVVANWAQIPTPFNTQQWCFWFGPLFGAIIAAIGYEFGTLKPENFAGAKDMDKSLFSADKKKRPIKAIKRLSTSIQQESSDHSVNDVMPISGAVENPLNRPVKVKQNKTEQPVYSTALQQAPPSGFNSNPDVNHNRPPVQVQQFDGHDVDLDEV